MCLPNDKEEPKRFTNIMHIRSQNSWIVIGDCVLEEEAFTSGAIVTGSTELVRVNNPRSNGHTQRKCVCFKFRSGTAYTELRVQYRVG